MAEKLYGVAEWTLAVLPTGDIQFDIGYAMTPEEAHTGQTQHLQVVMSANQTRTLADELLKAAESSPQSSDTGRA